MILGFSSGGVKKILNLNTGETDKVARQHEHSPLPLLGTVVRIHLNPKGLAKAHPDLRALDGPKALAKALPGVNLREAKDPNDHNPGIIHPDRVVGICLSIKLPVVSI